ncbi:hypothetical protein LR48_Vigan02g023000 [Vigna angularis]|uniref:Uncharacterized protein n=1 Tax=Phaseolus angularis TaxID=3914 RepID=A0A0L9TU58_PHAAN|nr:hypothetical protein LR48_Vigan02g023000 [Vigna angularis]
MPSFSPSFFHSSSRPTSRPASRPPSSTFPVAPPYHKTLLKDHKTLPSIRPSGVSSEATMSSERPSRRYRRPTRCLSLPRLAYTPPKHAAMELADSEGIFKIFPKTLPSIRPEIIDLNCENRDGEGDRGILDAAASSPSPRPPSFLSRRSNCSNQTEIAENRDEIAENIDGEGDRGILAAAVSSPSPCPRRRRVHHRFSLVGNHRSRGCVGCVGVVTIIVVRGSTLEDGWGRCRPSEILSTEWDSRTRPHSEQRMSPMEWSGTRPQSEQMMPPWNGRGRGCTREKEGSLTRFSQMNLGERYLLLHIRKAFMPRSRLPRGGKGSYVSVFLPTEAVSLPPPEKRLN